MFRFMFAMVLCLGFSIPSHAFFTDLIQAAEALFEAHESEIEKREKTGKQLAEDLDKNLANFKQRAKKTFEKIAKSGLVSPKFKQKLLDSLTVLEDEVTRRIEEAKKALTTSSAPDL